VKNYYALCVDDDQSILNQLALQLEAPFEEFCEFEYAESAAEALELYHELSADGNCVWLIICDQVMPGMAGDEFLANIYQRDRQVLKVLLTGQAGLESTIRAINHAGLNYYLEKPWEKDDLVMIVERLKYQFTMTVILSDMQSKFAASIDLYETLQTVFDNTLDVLQAEAGAIFLADPFSNTLSCKTSRGLWNLKGVNIPSQIGLIGKVVQTGEMHLAQHVGINDLYGDFLPKSAMVANSVISAPLRSKDEVLGVLQVMNKKGRPQFNEDDVHLLQALSTGAALAIQNAQYAQRLLQEERIRSELLIAHQIQQGILPDPFPPHPDIHFEAINLPAKDVGGDFYDYFHVSDAEFAFFIGDVCGKGVPAAIFMASSHSIIKSQARSNPLPERVIALANELITEDAQEGMFVTVFYGLYHTQSRRLQYLNAGHTVSLLFRPTTASCASLLNTNLPLGIFALAQFRGLELQLEQGDTLIFYTDGVNEAINEQHEQFGVPRLVELVLTHGNRSPKDLLQEILAAVQTFSVGMEQQDDITVMIMRV